MTGATGAPVRLGFIAAGQRAGMVLVVGQQMRYHLHLNRMCQLIAAGRIGPPQMAWLKEFRNPFPATMTWAFDRSRSGGAVGREALAVALAAERSMDTGQPVALTEVH